MMGEWLLVVVAGSLVGYVHAQLGEGGHHTTTITTTTQTTTTPDHPLNYDYHEVDDAEEDDEDEPSEGVAARAPRRWKPVEQTYMGCLHNQTNFAGTLMFVNLQEVEVDEPLTSLEAACYQLCLDKKPFAEYITVAEAVNGSADACGCYYEGDLDLENTVNDVLCAGGMLGYYGVYCGPGDEECFSGAPAVGCSALALVMIVLPLLLTS